MHGAYTHGLVSSYLEDSRLEQTFPTASWHTIWTMLQQPSGQHEDLSLDPERWPNHLLPSFPIPRWWHCLVPRNAMKELASGPQPVTPWVAWKWRLLAGYSALGMCASFSGQALAIPAGHRTSLFSFCTPHVPSRYSSKLCSEHGTEWKWLWAPLHEDKHGVFLYAWEARRDWNTVPETADSSSLSQWEDTHRHHFLKDMFNFVTDSLGLSTWSIGMIQREAENQCEDAAGG